MTRGPFERCPWLTLQPHGALPHGLGRCLASLCSCQLYGLVGQHLSPSTRLAARRTRVAVRWDIKWLRSPFLLFSAVVNGMSSWKTAKMVNQRWAYQNPLCSCVVSDFAYDWLLFCTVFIWERVWAGSPRYKCLDGTSCWEDFLCWKMATGTGCWAREDLGTLICSLWEPGWGRLRSHISCATTSKAGHGICYYVAFALSLCRLLCLLPCVSSKFGCSLYLFFFSFIHLVLHASLGSVG